jgi:hypothetical protein
VVKDDLIVTNGATQGLYMLASLLFSAGDLVFVEDPTYFVALKLLQKDIGLQCVPGIHARLPQQNNYTMMHEWIINGPEI